MLPGAPDSNDTAPGLETPDGWPAAVVAPSSDGAALRWFAARCYSNGETGLIFRWSDTEPEALACAARLMADFDDDPPLVQDDDCAPWLVVDHPSPGDDITRAAFDAMDGAA